MASCKGMSATTPAASRELSSTWGPRPESANTITGLSRSSVCRLISALSGRLVISMQAIFILSYGNRTVKPIRVHPDVLILISRCCHRTNPTVAMTTIKDRAPAGARHLGANQSAGTGEHWGQVRWSLPRWQAATASRRRCAARWWDGRCSRLRGQGAIHPGDLPAQLPVGANATA